MKMRMLAVALSLCACALGAAGQSPGFQPGQDGLPAPGQQGMEPGQASDQQGAAQSMPMTPAMLASKMHATNQLEIKLGRLAQEKGQSAEVRRYGRLLERDHSMGDKKVLGLAKKQGLQLTTPPPSPEQQEMMQKLQQASGEEFDREFLTAMKKGHDKAIDMLSKAQGKIQDPELASLIAKMLPILKQHDHLAAGLQG